MVVMNFYMAEKKTDGGPPLSEDKVPSHHIG
jgi:hypothetical protein